MSRAATAVGLLCLCGCSSSPGDVLVYTRTAGFRHDSIPAAVDALRAMAAAERLSVEHTEDPAALAPARLPRYAAVVFLHTTGDMLDSDAVNALAGYVRAGGGFLGIHGAADALHGSATYRDLLGALFRTHPPLQSGTLVVEDASNAATASLPAPWQHVDEFYDFDVNPRGTVRVLLRADESSYQGGSMGSDHPIAWCHAFGKGRSFYTALGHPIESWSDPVFLEHVRGALQIATGRAAADCSPD